MFENNKAFEKTRDLKKKILKMKNFNIFPYLKNQLINSSKA